MILIADNLSIVNLYLYGYFVKYSSLIFVMQLAELIYAKQKA